MDAQTIYGLSLEIAAQQIPEFARGEWEISAYSQGTCASVRTPRELKFLGEYHFFLDFMSRLSHTGLLEINALHRGEGLGRRLVGFRESLCQSLGIKEVVINQNANPGFWRHMDYKELSKKQQELLREKNVWIYDDFANPVYKMLQNSRGQPEPIYNRGQIQIAWT